MRGWPLQGSRTLLPNGRGGVQPLREMRRKVSVAYQRGNEAVWVRVALKALLCSLTPSMEAPIREEESRASGGGQKAG